MIALASQTPFDELPFWHDLPVKERLRVRKMAIACAAIQQTPYKGKGAMVARVARELGVSVPTINREYAKWKIEGVTGLVKRSYLKGCEISEEGKNSLRFKDWLIEGAGQSQRSTAAWLQRVEDAFLTGSMEVPGFEHHIPGRVPYGCSRKSLERIINGNKLELDVRRHGLRYADSQLPSLHMTREGLKPGQRYAMDDMWHDHYVVVNGKPVRVLEFGCVDGASGCRIHSAFVPRTEKADGKMRGLDSQLFVAFVGYILRYIGVHPDGCVMMMEHGTASLPEANKLILQSHFGNKIRFEEGTLQGQWQKFFGGWSGRIGGNPRTKTWIESQGNMIHNMMGMLCGQAGRNRDAAPDGTNGMINYQQTLAAWEEKLREAGRDDLADALESPFLTLTEFLKLQKLTYDLLNSRANHNLEGWGDKTLLEYELAPGIWTPQHLLPDSPESTALIRHAVQTGNMQMRQRKLTPQEVWNAGRDELIRIPFYVYVDFIGTHFSRPVTVRRGEIRVEDSYFAPHPLIYTAQVNLIGKCSLLDNDTQYNAIINPYHLNSIIILDDSGRIFGEAEKVRSVSRDDKDAMAREMGRVKAHRAKMLEPARNRQAANNEAAAALQDRNTAIAREGGIIPGGRAVKPKGKPAGKDSISMSDFKDLF